MIIIISSPELSGLDLLEKEVEVMIALLDQGLERLHIRKPAAGLNQLAFLLERFPWQYREKLVLHPPRAFFGRIGLKKETEHLMQWMQQKGMRRLHIPSWLRMHPNIDVLLKQLSSRDNSFVLSTGMHTLEERCELLQVNQPGLAYDYVLVSPLFDSISKAGYRANAALWQHGRDRGSEFRPRLIAMGGMQAANLLAIKNAGFDGAALMGAIWQPFAMDGFAKREENIINYFKICADTWKNAIIN